LADARGKAWSLDHYNRQVKRPQNYKLPYLRFLGLPVGHEVGSHLLERVNGERSGFELLADSLDRTEFGNEGRAVIREQVVYDRFEDFTKLIRWQDLLRRHLATSLAYGLDGEPKNFPEIHRVIGAIDRLWEYSKGEPTGEMYTKARDRTWRLLESVFKGTDGTGTPYGRYAIYLEGNIACWREAAKDPQLISRGDIGKFDITNPRHIEVLQKNGILPVSEPDEAI
jgi:hypothetical protein